MSPAQAAHGGGSAAGGSSPSTELGPIDRKGVSTGMKVLVLSSLSWSLVNFRGRLLSELVNAGHEVVACAPDEEPGVLEWLAERRIRFHRTAMSRAGTNPIADLGTFLRYLMLMIRVRPDAVIAYTQKPIIYGGLASRLCGIDRYYVLMSGLGYVYSSEADRRPMLRRIVSRLYAAGVRKAKTIFVFNGDDRRMMMETGIIDTGQNVVQVPGSGIDTGYFSKAPLPDGPPAFIMISRLMRDKGVADYIEAARRIKAKRPEVRFTLVGRYETENPTGYSKQEVDGWVEEGLVEHVPETRDVRPFLARAHAFVLPSYYREGLPRTILEALSTGRPVITTDMPGCREPIEQGVNGWVVSPKSPDELAEAMLRLIEDRELARRMSDAARETAARCYDVDIVNAQLLSEMRLDVSTPIKAAVAAG